MIDDILGGIADLFNGDPLLMQGFVALLALSAIAYLVMTVWRSRTDVQRRVSGEGEAAPALAASGMEDASPFTKAVTRAADRFDPIDTGSRKVLRHRLMMAGLPWAGAVAYFFLARVVSLVLCAMLGAFLVMWWSPDADGFTLMLFVVGSGGVGYILPSFALDKRVAKLASQHRDGFPDFMDLMVVCCQAGLSMEAAINRVARELKLTYPSLARHLDMTTLEMRGGKGLGAAIDGMAKRLGIAEATSFSTLLQQSEELGSSLTESLRAYSDDMRNKRLMRAEEKAHALPAKLTVPLTLFVFPVLLVVIMLPVVIGVAAG